jgi:hypothetical protein
VRNGADFDVFVSYARGNGPAAAEQNDWLCAQGLTTFFDRGALRWGQRTSPDGSTRQWPHNDYDRILLLLF